MNFSRRIYNAVKNKAGDDAAVRENTNQSGSAECSGKINLTQLDVGKSAKVVKLQGGRQIVGKLEAMGIVPGTTIIKKSASIFKGPVVVERGNMQVAIGYEAARGIIVE